MNLNLEDVYDYSKLSNNRNFCRYVTVKQLVTKNKKTIDHKAIIFFSDFDIKRFINNEHILLMVLLYFQQVLCKQLFLYIMII